VQELSCTGFLLLGEGAAGNLSWGCHCDRKSGAFVVGFFYRTRKAVIFMMTAIRSYARQGQHLLRRFFLDPRVHTTAHILKYLLRGFLISAASLGQYPQPLAL